MFIMSLTALQLNAANVGEKVAYPGTLTKVYMNGDKDAGQTVTAYATLKANGNYKIELQEFQVGKMPGTIQVVADDVEVDDNGNFNMSEMDEIVILRLLGISKNYFNADLEGKIESGQLTFTVTTVDAKYLGASFKAVVTFKSK